MDEEKKVTLKDLEYGIVLMARSTQPDAETNLKRFFEAYEQLVRHDAACEIMSKYSTQKEG